MKTLIIVALSLSVLAGCSSRQPVTQSQIDDYTAQQKIQHDAEASYIKSHPEELQNSIAASEAEKADKREKQEREARIERLCEAMHPYMISQCMINSGINQMVDGL
ncbi:hypothetical protein PYR66_09980 [Klebsiella aerogenes]|nr:hypothetical protein PYR66_09980 [Klebsiella aerogenes]